MIHKPISSVFGLFFLSQNHSKETDFITFRAYVHEYLSIGIMYTQDLRTETPKGPIQIKYLIRPLQKKYRNVIQIKLHFEHPFKKLNNIGQLFETQGFTFLTKTLCPQCSTHIHELINCHGNGLLEAISQNNKA